MVHFTGLLENARHPGGGPCWGTLVLDPCKNWLPARIGGWPGTATGGQIHVVHISHTHPPKEIIQALRQYLLGKKPHNITDLLGCCWLLVVVPTSCAEAPCGGKQLGCIILNMYD